MEAQGVLDDTSTLPLVLKACARPHAVERGKKIHNIWDMNLINDVRVQTALVVFYCKCGMVEDAHHVFEEMS